MPAVVVAGAENPTSTTVLWQGLTPTVTSSPAAAGYPGINAYDPATWSSWKPVGMPGWLNYDFGSAVSLDGAGISAHNMATSGVTMLRLQASNDNSTWTAIINYSPLSNEDLMFIFPAVTFRYWRIVLEGGAANVGVLVFGKRLVFGRSPVDSYTPLHHARRYTKLFNDSLTGQFLGNRVMAVGAATDVDMGMFERTWIEGNIRPFEAQFNQGGTFFYASCPSLYPLDMGYCRAGSDDGILEIEWVEAEKLSTLSFGITSYVG